MTGETVTKNYRCPETVLEAGNDLIANNGHQIAKRAVAKSGRDTTPQLHVLDGYTDSAYARRVGEYVVHLIERYLANGSEPGGVMVLCRYDGAAPYLREVERRLRENGIPYNGKDRHYRPS